MFSGNLLVHPNVWYFVYYRRASSVLKSDDCGLDCSKVTLCTTDVLVWYCRATTAGSTCSEVTLRTADVLVLYYRATTVASTAPRSLCVLQTH